LLHPFDINAYFADDGEHILVRIPGSTLVYDNDGAFVRTIDQDGVARLDPTGRLLAVGSGSGNVDIFEFETLEPLGTLVGHRSNGAPIVFSDDGRRLLTGGYDHTVRVWDLDTMTQIGRVLPATNNFNAMTPDGERVVVATDDGLQLWDFDIDHWFEHACELAGRNLTDAEWEAFGPQSVERRATCPQYPI